MSGEGGRKRRKLSEEERALWRGVTRSVAPLRPLAEVAAEDDAGAANAVAAQARAQAAAKPGTQGSSAKRPTNAPAPKLPPLAPLERRAALRIGRGVQPIDGRLDLHGMTQTEAHAALLRFLAKAQTRGAGTVLVITGKGGRTGDGVLRRMAPLWLALPEFRPLVIGFDRARPTHGGDGALYVRVRKRG